MLLILEKKWKWGPPASHMRCGAHYGADCSTTEVFDANHGITPCCSTSAWCGNTEAHCIYQVQHDFRGKQCFIVTW